MPEHQATSLNATINPLVSDERPQFPVLFSMLAAAVRTSLHQVVVFAPDRHPLGEVGFGALKIGDTDYELNPLMLYSERTFVGRLKPNF